MFGLKESTWCDMKVLGGPGVNGPVRLAVEGENLCGKCKITKIEFFNLRVAGQWQVRSGHNSQIGTRCNETVHSSPNQCNSS